MPFGLERLALVPMGWGIDATIWVAEHVSAICPAMSGRCRACRWRGWYCRARRVVAVPVAGQMAALGHHRRDRAGLPTMVLTRPPDIVIADFGRFVAARAADGRLLRARRPWRAHRTSSFLPRRPAPRCCPGRRPARTGERARLRRRALPLYGARQAGRDRHRRARSAARLRRGSTRSSARCRPAFACRKSIPVVDRIDNWRRGAVALWLDPGGITVDERQ